LKTEYYILFTALLMPPYCTQPPSTIAFSSLSQFSYKFFLNHLYLEGRDVT